MAQPLDGQPRGLPTVAHSPRTLQTLRDNGTLAYSQIGHKIFYKPEDVQRIVRLVEDRRKDAAYRGCSI